jgi:hypothetical protein
LSAVLTELGRLTTRDHALLELLAEHRTLTTTQITGVFFGSPSRARARLATLRHRDLLDRFRHYEPGKQQWRWTLGPLGAAVVASGHDRPIPRPSAVRDATVRLATSPVLPHLVEVNEFFTTLLAAGRTRPPGQSQRGLARWWNERRTREATGGLARPDGHGVWIADGRGVPFWAEIDRGSETLARVAGKLVGYQRLVGSRWGLPVLFWLPTPAREANLRGLLARTGVPAGLTVATAATAHGSPAGPVWAPVAATSAHTRIRLVDLPGARPVPVAASATEPGIAALRSTDPGGVPWAG